MRIHRLVLRNFRGVHEADVTFAASGITIVEGDNEVGKMSLAEALNLVFEHLDSSKKSAVKAVQPVHRDVGPEVEVHFEAGPYRARYTKRWLKKPATTLDVSAPVRLQLTGREAHDRVNQILDETLDRDLWQALRVEQGKSLDPGQFAMPSLSRALEAAVGSESAGDGEDALWDRIVAERDRYWQANGRPNHERQGKDRQLAEAQEKVREIQASMREIDARADDIARLELAGMQLVATQEGLVEQSRRMEGLAAEVAGLRRDLDTARSQAELAQSAHGRWLSEHESRNRLVTELENRRKRSDEARSALDTRQPELSAAQTELDGLVRRRAELDSQVVEAEAALAVASAHANYRRWQIELAQFGERRQRVIAAHELIAQAEIVLSGPPVGPDQVEAIEAAHIEVARAEAAAQAGAATVTVTAEDTLELVGPDEAVVLRPGQTHVVGVTDHAQLSLRGVASFEVQAGAGASALAERCRQADHELAQLCRAHQVDDLAHARALAAEQVEAARVKAEQRARLAADLRDLTLEGIERKIESLSTRIEAHETGLPAASEVPADHDSAQEAETRAEAHLRDRRAAWRQINESIQAVEGTAEKARTDAAALALAVEFAVSAEDDARAALESEQARLPDLDIAEQLQAARQNLDDAQAFRGEAQERLTEADPDTLEVLVDNAALAVKRGEAAIRDNQNARRDLVAVVEDRGEQGLAQRLDVAQAVADRLQVERASLEARAEAAWLLHRTFENRRSEARSRFVAPFRDAIERLGRLVFGPTFAVELDADLGIASRTLDGITVPFAHMSVGAREQCALISRLACASLVSADGGGAPVVIDDAMGWTDPTRLGLVAAAIGVAGRDCQVIVLTCTPGRFAGVGGAHVVHLSEGERVQPPQVRLEAGSPTPSASA